ncbi:unnamed protein product [Angiostrongylus costaricensis]|uniref:Secreted protein n=1 Tax=Angiostrongylus costaricensis TaxID=334426 RepID=A0A0R3PNX7_ANGCS|nr:unnamed protein product [Angiostrongylus costaricensis]
MFLFGILVYHILFGPNTFLGNRSGLERLSSSAHNSATPTPADRQQLVAVLRQRTLVDVNDNDCFRCCSDRRRHRRHRRLLR